MQTESVTCNQCGAPLTVPEVANFVTCNHCESRLAIRRTDTVTFTEKLERRESNQSEMLSRLHRLERQNEVASIDRQWEREKKSYMVSDKHGQHEPSVAGAVVMFLVAGFGLVFAATGFLNGTPIALFGLIFAAIACLGGFYHLHKTSEFRAARKRYYRRRRAVYDRPEASSSTYLNGLEQIPTPQEYLNQLEDDGIRFE